MIAQIPFDEKKYKTAIEERASRRKDIQRWSATASVVRRLRHWGGYIGEGSKTVLPSKAFAKFSCRLVPHQNHEKIGKMMEEYMQSIAPSTVTVKVHSTHGGEAYVCPITLPAYQVAAQAVAIAFGVKPLAVRRGEVPVINVFEKELGLKSILMGFGWSRMRSIRPTKAVVWIISLKE